ncbi:hypothetical protein ABW20_dc0101741 [Dactylellina cionopaga]|nr:hypothetical protein ABW20_dc0101741 [Dactylellina cionopaga]
MRLQIMPVVAVTNNYPYPIYVFVSTYTGRGEDRWFYLAQGARETWVRNDGWEVVVAKNVDDTWREGSYLRTDAIYSAENRELENLSITTEKEEILE